MGMFIGASIITLFEAVDVFLLALARRWRYKVLRLLRKSPFKERPPQ